MRRPCTQSRYVAREVATCPLIGLAAIAIVVARILVRVPDPSIGVPASSARIACAVNPLAARLAIDASPVSFLFGVPLATGRRAGDVEIIAMRACAAGIRGLLAPLARLGVGLSLSTFALCLEGEPAARREVAVAGVALLVRARRSS
jgi:lipopolysaccharide export LptBFGC system permease protein LptF